MNRVGRARPDRAAAGSAACARTKGGQTARLGGEGAIKLRAPTARRHWGYAEVGVACKAESVGLRAARPCPEARSARLRNPAYGI